MQSLMKIYFNTLWRSMVAHGGSSARRSSALSL
jgi:hypothetical protein